MADRLWDRADEWTGHAPCGGDTRFGTAPEWDGGTDRVVLSGEDEAFVRRTCGTCPVRPECISDGLRDKSNSVWIAGVWMPDSFTAASRRALDRQREELAGLLPDERVNRPDSIR